MLGGTPGAPSPGFSLPTQQGPESQRHPLDTVEVGIELEKELLSKVLLL